MARVALVTGGTRGIGAGIAKRLKQDGHTVVVCDVVDEQIVKFKEETGIPGYKINVADFNDVAEGVKKIEAEVGPIDIVVNNAGITRDARFVKMTREKNWDPVIAVNLTSTFMLCRAAARAMLRAKPNFGRIINIASVSGVFGNPGQGNYAASKAGMIGMTKALAQEVGSRGITVNCIAPGFIETEMTDALDPKQVDEWRKAIPLRRGGTPEDVAKATAFLASDDSSYISGQVLQVDGGMLT